jgi:phosphopantothenoylcysteine decarboxylase/phosphopantothenate--cysteine ligase
VTIQDKHILVAVSGGIAAFKAVELVRELGRRGARVKVALTPNAARFVGPVTFTGLTGEPALLELWDASYPGEQHVVLADWADAIVVAPATANLLARAAQGMADDLVLATLACARNDCPVLLAPAMHTRMWQRPGTQRNIQQLQRDGLHCVGPTVGKLANGKIGEGRMSEPTEIVDALEQLLRANSDLVGSTVVISAGPTLEDIDPVRFISNRSSGRMGYAIATAARDRGASVVLVTGPTSIPVPSAVEVVQVRSAIEMQSAIQAAVPRADIIIMTAAVADYRSATQQQQKMKKQGDTLTIELVKNPDILAELGAARARNKSKHPVLVGFAMETQNIAAYGRSKLTQKRVDLIVANEAKVAFGGDHNEATLISHVGEEALPPMPKRELADRILDRARELLATAAAGSKLKENRPAPRPRAPTPARRPKGRSRSKG